MLKTECLVYVRIVLLNLGAVVKALTHSTHSLSPTRLPAPARVCSKSRPPCFIQATHFSLEALNASMCLYVCMYTYIYTHSKCTFFEV